MAPDWESFSDQHSSLLKKLAQKVGQKYGTGTSSMLVEGSTRSPSTRKLPAAMDHSNEDRNDKPFPVNSGGGASAASKDNDQIHFTKKQRVLDGSDFSSYGNDSIASQDSDRPFLTTDLSDGQSFRSLVSDLGNRNRYANSRKRKLSVELFPENGKSPVATRHAVATPDNSLINTPFLMPVPYLQNERLPNSPRFSNLVNDSAIYNICQFPRLTNHRQACYQNVVYQGLYSLSGFRDQFAISQDQLPAIEREINRSLSISCKDDKYLPTRSYGKTRETGQRRDSLSELVDGTYQAEHFRENLKISNHVKHLFYQMSLPNSEPIDAFHIHKACGSVLDSSWLEESEKFDGETEQDSVEFLRMFIDALQKEDYCVKNAPRVNLVSKQICCECGTVKTLPDDWSNTLTAAFPDKGDSGIDINIMVKRALWTRCQFKHLQCDSQNCKAKGQFQADKEWSHARLDGRPECLIVDAPLDPRNKHRDKVSLDDETIVLPAFDKQSGEMFDVRYQLRSVATILTNGEHGGHYKSLRKFENHWFEINDNPEPTVKGKTLQEFKDLAATGRMFFYERHG
ncbi:MAG: hypothetical protein Q9227_004121 [Pyrenula ochraceoflavens]